MAERKSKPRKAPVEDEQKHYNWWQLSMFLVSAIAIIFLMVIVSKFLSGGGSGPGGGPDTWLYIAFGSMVVVAGLLWLMSRWAKRNA